MADVCVSYARRDRALVAPLVAGLEAAGWSVWWDHQISPGQEFDDLIAQELGRARCVVAVWTESSVGSRWVRGEAREAADRNVLLPVRFGGVQLPIDVRAIHTTDLDGWGEDLQHPSFQQLVRAIRGLLNTETDGTTAQEQPRRPPRLSICVLPFENISGDPEQDYFSDGISEDIITDLSHISSLEVTSRNTAFTYKGRRVGVPEVARQLRVTHILEGSVRKAGNRVRITAQLIEASADAHLWAERYDRDLDDIFAVQDDISRSIVAALKLRLAPAESQAIAQRGTSNSEAYRFYLMARRYWVGGWSRRRGVIVRLCERAVELDPDYARAWALLSICQADLRFSADNSGQYGIEAAERALALDPDLAEAHSAKGRVLAAQGRLGEGWEHHLRALALDPASYEVNAGAARWAFSAGRFAEAKPFVDAAAEADGSDVWAPGMAMQVYEALGDKPGALAQARECLARVEKVLAAEPDNGAALAFGVSALVRLGELDRARDWAELVLLVDPDNSNAVYNVACGMAQAGEADLALKLLAKPIATVGLDGLQSIHKDTDWDPLRNDPRFTALLDETARRLGVEPKPI